MPQKPVHYLIVFVSAFALLIGGCGKPSVADPDSLATARVVSITVPGTPWYEEWVHLKRELEKSPKNRLDVRLYITGQLGSEESALSQLRRGRVQLGGFSLQGATSVIPELEILLAPYLFNSLAEVDFIIDQYLTTKFKQLFAERGLVLLNWAEVGWTNLYGRTPILTPEQAAHLKLRSSNALSSQLFIQAIGSDMVPMPFPDIIPSLQTGLIKGGASGIVFYAISGIPKEAPHLTLTRHAFDTGVVLANKAWFDQLPTEQRDLLVNSLHTQQEQRQAVRDTTERILAAPEKYGIKLHGLDAAQQNAWEKITRRDRQAIIDRIGGEGQAINRLIEKGKREFAARGKEESTKTL